MSQECEQTWNIIPREHLILAEMSTSSSCQATYKLNQPAGLAVLTLRHFIPCDIKIVPYIKQEPNRLVSYPESNEISSHQDTGSTT